MKRTFFIITFIGLLVGCNINPNKEDRIQKLESSVVSLEKINEELKTRGRALENN